MNEYIFKRKLNVELSPKVEKYLLKLDYSTKERIKKGLCKLSE